MYKKTLILLILWLCGSMFGRQSHIQAQEVQLLLDGVNDADLDEGSGLLQIGATSDINIVMDRNEILARNNGQKSTLFLNIEGGSVQAGDDTKPSDFWATGYTKLGNDLLVPEIKTRMVTGTTPAAGTTDRLAHGLSEQSKIISAYVVAEQDISGAPYYEHYIVDWHDQTNVAVTSSIGNNKNYKLLLIYIK